MTTNLQGCKSKIFRESLKIARIINYLYFCKGKIWMRRPALKSGNCPKTFIPESDMWPCLCKTMRLRAVTFVHKLEITKRYWLKWIMPRALQRQCWLDNQNTDLLSIYSATNQCLLMVRALARIEKRPVKKI